MIIFLILVLMVNLRKIFWVWYERSSDKNMNANKIAFAFFMQSYNVVSISIYHATHNFPFNAFISSFLKRNHPIKRMNPAIV